MPNSTTKRTSTCRNMGAGLATIGPVDMLRYTREELMYWRMEVKGGADLAGLRSFKVSLFLVNSPSLSFSIF